MFKNFLMKQMLKKQMKDVPEAEQEKIFKMVEQNPDFFQKVAAQVQTKVSQGMSQMDAAMAVMKENQSELTKLMK